MDPKDFFNIVKVDNHIHLAAAMTARHLLEFIQKKYKESPEEIVIQTKEGPQTLRTVFENLALVPEELTINALDVYVSPFSFSMCKLNRLIILL